MRSWVSKPVAATLAAAAVALGAGGIYAANQDGGDDPDPACTQTFTTSNVGTSPYYGNNVLSAVAGGGASTVLCFSSGSYGEVVLYNANPSGRVTIRPVEGAEVAGIRFNLNGVSNVTIQDFNAVSMDGLLLQVGDFGDNEDITFQRNLMDTVGVVLRDNTGTNANIQILDNDFVGFEAADNDSSRFYILNMGGCPNGVTVEGNLFSGGRADGIQTGGDPCGTVIRENEFTNIIQSTCGGIHCDGFQDAGGGQQTQLIDNYFHDIESGIMAYDGTQSGYVVRGNVLDDMGVDNVINLGDTDNSTVEHNTVADAGDYINFGSKAGRQSTGVTVRSNIAPGGIQSNGAGTAATYTVNDYNMCTSSCGAGANSVTGTAVFTGGSSPAAWADYALTGASPGVNVAHDGTDIGAIP